MLSFVAAGGGTATGEMSSSGGWLRSSMVGMMEMSRRWWRLLRWKMVWSGGWCGRWWRWQRGEVAAVVGSWRSPWTFAPFVGNKMHKTFPLPAIKFPLPEELPTASEFRMQQYLQHEHYALWEVIEFGDSYEAPANDPSTTTTNTTSGEAGTKSGRTVTLTTEDRQKKKNDVKARTTLLLSLSDEHQLQFSQLQFMDVEVEQDDLNQKYLTSLAPEWLMHTIVWRNRSDLDTISLDDLYNHLKVYEIEVQKKTEPNTQIMAFISSTKHSRGNDEVNTASVYTASSNVPTVSANVATKKTGKKISIQGSDVAGFDKSKAECFNCHKMSHFARECRAPRNQDRGSRDNYRHGSKAEDRAPKALMAIDGVGWDWS
nr:hypothetical protein [Tanacetum cinerariifolium]